MKNDEIIKKISKIKKIAIKKMKTKYEIKKIDEWWNKKKSI